MCIQLEEAAGGDKAFVVLQLSEAACVYDSDVSERTCQLTREDKFSTIRRFSVRIGGGFRLKQQEM